MPKKSAAPIVAITGASGFLGHVLIEHFTGKGWQVRALVRGATKYKNTNLVRYVEYDLDKPPRAHLLDGANYLVHAAFVKKGREYPDAIKVNVRAAERLVAASRKANLKKNVFISSMSSHEDAVSDYGRQKLAIEKVFDSRKDVSLRPGLIIGNGGIVASMGKFMKTKHAVPLIGGGRQPLQIVAVHELAEVVEHALTSKLWGVFTVAHPEVYTYKQFYSALAKHLRVKVVFVPVPFALLYGMMRTVQALHLPLSVSTDNLLGLKKLRAADTVQDLSALGVKLSPLQKAFTKERVT